MSGFTGHLGLQLIENADGDPLLTDDGRCQWAVAIPLSYDVGAEGSGETITVPAGATTDLGSTPQISWSLGFSPDSAGAKAFVIHDLLYRTKGTCVLNGVCYRTRALPYTRAEADGILREALAVLGVSAFRRGVMWAAVRLGGQSGWGR